jgi:hypothetical protein
MQGIAIEHNKMRQRKKLVYDLRLTRGEPVPCSSGLNPIPICQVTHSSPRLKRHSRRLREKLKHFLQTSDASGPPDKQMARRRIETMKGDPRKLQSDRTPKGIFSLASGGWQSQEHRY